MKHFMDENFLLRSPTAQRLYHNYAQDMPIFDYHCHLSPQEIAENKKYRNITEIWLAGDHYKWRAMRANGVSEEYITGDAGDKEKFLKWAETVPACIGNPLYHWTHLELRRYFGIDLLLSPDTAEEIWEECNRLLQQDDFRARSLIERSNVKGLCTTDDPTDSLAYHQALARDKSFGVKVYPTFRPDKSFNIDQPGFTQWLEKLEAAVGGRIQTFSEFTQALGQRMDFFAQHGCALSDHALDPIVYREGSEALATGILQKTLAGEKLSQEEVEIFKTQVLIFLGRQYADRGWVMQLHLSSIRNNSARMHQLLGPDTGFDSMDDRVYGRDLVAFLSKLDETNQLPKTILYSLNPSDNDLLATIAGSFQGGGIPGKMQLGSGWWFNDQKDGMLRQMTALANIGLLSRFVGMLTDSRSFLSYTRHEYFRRILCDLLGTWVEEGEAPHDLELMGGMVKDICFDNAVAYFPVELTLEEKRP
ncbi:MAG: glucuronate isomerase [Firmicutes bacterium]|nr:glucuronate isomerase [Bacillota bacterium]